MYGFVIDNRRGWLEWRMGQGLWFISALVRDTKTPEYRERPPRLHLTNAERGNPAVIRKPGMPTVREAHAAAGTGCPEKRMPAAERQRETGSNAVG